MLHIPAMSSIDSGHVVHLSMFGGECTSRRIPLGAAKGKRTNLTIAGEQLHGSLSTGAYLTTTIT